MNTIVIVLLVALTTTGLALIHETRLHPVARYVLRRLIRSLRHSGKAHDHARMASGDGL
jgi:hypothetical protein